MRRLPTTKQIALALQQTANLQLSTDHNGIDQHEAQQREEIDSPSHLADPKSTSPAKSPPTPCSGAVSLSPTKKV